MPWRYGGGGELRCQNKNSRCGGMAPPDNTPDSLKITFPECLWGVIRNITHTNEHSRELWLKLPQQMPGKKKPRQQCL